MIASLGMYDFGATRTANDRLWALIRDALRARNLPAPETLVRGEGAYWPAWESPDLTLAQTCGYPFRTRLHDRVTLIGTPDYALPGCPPGHYTSVFVARAEDPRRDLAAFAGARFAWNEDLSQSGWAAPMTHLAGLGLRVALAGATGGHRLSARAVAEGRADLAGIDALTWALMQDAGEDASLHEIARTAPTPGLPLIARAGADQPAIFAAVTEAIAALSPGDRAALHLRRLVTIPVRAYLTVPNPPDPVAYAKSI